MVSPGSQAGFLGISYITFRALDIVFCLRDNVIAAPGTIDFLMFLFFFPTISAGPIDRYRRFASDWRRKRTRAEFLGDLDGAVHRLFRGFVYKFIVAALIKQHWLEPAARSGSFRALLSYMYAYSFYLFFDFAGYSAFAIALSYLFGVHTPENFRQPFLARNIRDFWNRWHITLSFSRSRLHALPACRCARQMVCKHKHRRDLGIFSCIRVNGPMAWDRAALHCLWSLPGDAALGVPHFFQVE
jgi:membrane protein involved in D-alanine export